MMNSPWILMLEDDADDRYITSDFFAEHHFDIPVHFTSGSDSFLSRLKDPGKLPALALITVTPVPSDAVALIKAIRNSAHTQHLPVIVLCGVQDEKLVRECYAAGANSFIQKPSGSKETSEKILNFLRYWFETVELS